MQIMNVKSLESFVTAWRIVVNLRDAVGIGGTGFRTTVRECLERYCRERLASSKCLFLSLFYFALRSETTWWWHVSKEYVAQRSAAESVNSYPGQPQ